MMGTTAPGARGELVHLRPLMANLRYVKDVLTLPRGRG